jgi:hypothetical protein
MREKMQKQTPLMNPATDHDQAKELEAIDAILKKHPTICDLVYQDLCANRCVNTSSGVRGMSAEQVLRAAIESGISWLKRSFGLWRCTCKGLRSFKSYVWFSIVAAILLTLSLRPDAM